MTTQEKSSNRQWVEHEFAGVSLGDKRRDGRLLDNATAIADRPQASNPQRLEWKELRAFYLLMNGPRAQLDILQSGHRECTRQRMLHTPNRLLNIHDTTDLDFTNHPAVHDDVGPIGDGDGVGLLQHNTLVFDPEGKQLLGLLHQQLYRRPPREPQLPRETRQQRAGRADKESRLWLNGFRAIGPCPPGCQWIDVCDRGADYFEAMQTSRQLGHDFLIRVYQDRRVQVRETTDTGAEEEHIEHLQQTLAKLEPCATKVVTVASKGGRPARTVTVQVGYQSVRLQPPQPDGFQRGLLSLPVTLVRVWEAGALEARAAATQARQHAAQLAKEVKTATAAAAVVGPTAQAATALAELRGRWEEAKAQTKARQEEVSQYLDWWLATSVPIHNSADALQCVSDYEWRWPVAEEYHKVEKTGLRLESQRFEKGASLQAVLALLAVMAVRLMQLRYARDAQPEAPAETVATAEEIDMAKRATNFRGHGMTVRQFVDGVARLGGYLGRKSDGPPGWQSLWRGYQRLADLLWGRRLAEQDFEVEPCHNDPD